MLNCFKRFHFKLLGLKNMPSATVTRSLTGAQEVKTNADFDDDMPVEMEDPFKPEPERCFLCGVRVDYKNVQLLSQFVSSYTAVPVSQRMSGLCEKKYNEVLLKIKLSRTAGYMAYRTKETTFLEDPDVVGRIKRKKFRKVPGLSTARDGEESESFQEESSAHAEYDDDGDEDDEDGFVKNENPGT